MITVSMKALLLFGTCALFRMLQANHVFNTLKASEIASLQEIPILSPVPISGAWQGGQTMRVAGMIAQDILNSQQYIIPGYYLNHTWLDDTCKSNIAVKTALSAWNSRLDWFAFGAHGCSADCMATAPAASALRIPMVAYGCASVALADAAKYPHFSRMMGSEGDYVNGYAALANRFKWERISVMSGLPARWDATTAYMTEQLKQLSFNAVRVGPSSRMPTWEDMLDVMTDMKRMASRVIIVLMYSPDYAKMACAAKVVGMPKGIVWLYHGGNPPVNFLTHGKDLTDFDSSCTPEATQPYWEGAIGLTDWGRPASDTMLDRQLDCFPNYTARTFHKLLDEWLVSGYPANENTITNLIPVIQGNAVDGTCVWAYTVKHMLSKNYTFQQLQRPSEEVFLEMIRYIKEDLDFWGVIGRVKFNGSPNIKHTLSISQVQNGQLVAIDLYDQSADIFVPIGNKTLVWGDGNSTPTAYFAFCAEGTEMDSNADCVPCNKGTYYEPLLKGCIGCPNGFIKNFTGGVGVQECTACPAGSYANSSGMSVCSLCSIGTYSKQTGQDGCEPCASGRFGPTEGLASCNACDIGSYQNLTGQVSCEPCGAVLSKSVTPYLGASQSDNCACPPQTYTFGKMCRDCTEGLLCDSIGLDAPQQEEGYKVETISGSATSRDVEVSIYKCRAASDCPAGSLSACATGHSGIACGTCVDGYFKSGSGKCIDCDAAGDVGVTVAVSCMIAVLLLCSVGFVLRKTSKERRTTMTAGLAAGQLVFALQTMGVYRQMSITWPEPVASLLSVLQIFSFDVEVVRFSCVIGKNDIVTTFAFQLVGVPCVLIMLATLTKVTGVIRGIPKFDFVKFMNLVGLLMMVCYVTIAIAMLQPLYCVGHPNGKRSMMSNYSVVCWEGSDHIALIVMSVLGTLLYPISLLAIVAAATFSYPRLVASGQGMQVLAVFDFLFKRFTPECYFWGFFYLLRNLLIAATPVLVPDSGSWQILIVSIVFVLGMNSEAYLFPWRTTVANATNVVSLGALLILLQSAAALIVVKDTTFTGTVIFILALCLLAGLLSVAGYGVFGVFFPGNKYDVFLSHHKDGAGSFARWLKMQITAKKLRASVFYDSDFLDEIDGIVDIVAIRTKKLVLLMSRLVLTRPWCAAEVTSAVHSNVPVIKIQLEDYEPQGSESIPSLMDGWSEEQKVALARNGVSTTMVETAYAKIWELSAVSFNRLEPIAQQLTCLGEVLNAVLGVPKSSRALMTPKAKIIVIGASMDAEARFTCEVMALLLQKKLEINVVVVHSTLDISMQSGSALYMLVVITRGVLQDDIFKDVLLESTNLQRNVPLEFVPALADQNFAFPSPSQLASMYTDIGPALQKVFNVLALPFSSLGSTTLQDTQISEITRRFSKLDQTVKLFECASPSPIASNHGDTDRATANIGEVRSI